MLNNHFYLILSISNWENILPNSFKMSLSEILKYIFLLFFRFTLLVQLINYYNIIFIHNCLIFHTIKVMSPFQYIRWCFPYFASTSNELKVLLHRSMFEIQDFLNKSVFNLKKKTNKILSC